MDMEKTTVLWVAASLGYLTDDVRDASEWLCGVVDGMSDKRRVMLVLGESQSVEGIAAMMRGRLGDMEVS